MRRDIRRRVFCPVISPAWRRRIGSGPLAAAVGRQREPLALVHDFRSGVVLDDLGAFDRCPATLRVGVFKSLGRVRRGPVGLIRTQVGIKYKKPTSVVETYKTTYRHKADIGRSLPPPIKRGAWPSAAPSRRWLKKLGEVELLPSRMTRDGRRFRRVSPLISRTISFSGGVADVS
jgi:hypothetical protein